MNPYNYLHTFENHYDSSRTPANTDRIFYGWDTTHAMAGDNETYKVLLKNRWIDLDNHYVKGYDAFLHSDHAPVEWSGSIECLKASIFA